MLLQGNAFTAFKGGIVNQILSFIDEQTEDIFDFGVLLSIVAVFAFALGGIRSILGLRVNVGPRLLAGLVGILLLVS